jgi:hypothetical protein
LARANSGYIGRAYFTNSAQKRVYSARRVRAERPLDEPLGGEERPAADRDRLEILSESSTIAM